MKHYKKFIVVLVLCLTVLSDAIYLVLKTVIQMTMLESQV